MLVSVGDGVVGDLARREDHPPHGSRIELSWIVEDLLEPTAGELVDFVARTLSAHKRPRQVRFVDALPRNAMGKVQKQLLKA